VHVILPLAWAGIAFDRLLCLVLALERGVLVAQPELGQGRHAGRR
jgi:hypothetical protein